MSFLTEEEKRRMLIMQIEKTAEEIRKGQKLGISPNYTHFFGLRSSGMYSKISVKSKEGIVWAWFLIVMFLVCSTAILIFMKKFDII
ncbi:uncharacterized protein Eint_050465 [Encephalitozoon intestinalis ATCC 50506]|uniref:Uncharacterized protein n=1 Tax=Encephalitozoon intestinalis (strain ATCC 50506) TaxID=876142 RepID=W8PGP4_ENCIT|nr:uncharacterized protein Eint_050465 [Encephalitozoon intestinalis ATCC 50506]AHL30101.1 hypothetical protein Eint_050465 [Encephalitozoon intestinalis ATCC 50506]UTX45208.1 hypothetical protein GPK93_05g07520 [Encephalitozoon intestinalis]